MNDGKHSAIARNHAGYRERRKYYKEIEADYAKIVDKTIIAIAGGGLGISIAFLDSVAPSDTRKYVCLLLFAWLAWTGALLLVFIAMFVCQAAHERYARALDKEARSDGALDETYWARCSSRLEKLSGWATAVEWLNRSAVTLVVAGVLLMVLFAFSNV